MQHSFTVYDYLIFFVCIVLGQAFHLVIKGNSIKKKNIMLGKPFDFVNDFIKVDSLEIAGALLAGVISMMVYSEAVGIYPKLGMAQKFLFILVGYTGSSLVLAALSKADKAANKAIKEDIFNNKTETKMEEFVINYESNTDKVKGDSGATMTIDEYASISFGINNSSVKQIVYITMPTGVTFVRRDTSTYLSQPVRRPK